MKTSNLGRTLGSLVLTSLMFLTVGCETTAPSAKPKTLEQKVSIQRGTSVADLIVLLGEPSAKRALDTPELVAEIWTYDRTLSTKTAEEVTGMQESIYWDAFRREMITIERPVTETKVTVNKEVTDILIVDGVVHNWKRRTVSNSQIGGKSR